MTDRKSARPIRLGPSMIVVAGLLTGCGPGGLSSQNARIGADDGTDVCRPYVVALDSTGNYFAADIMKGAAIGALGGGLAGGLIGGDWKGALIGAGAGAILGGASSYWMALQQQAQDQAVLNARVSGDLQQENGAIDRTQAAFNQVMDCRFRQANEIQADYAARRIDRPNAVARMSWVKARAQRDLETARRIDSQIAGRGAQFEVAADNLEPAPAATASRPVSRPATVRTAAALKLRPDPAAPEIGTLQASQPVTVGPVRNGYALVSTQSGQQGYASATAISGGRGLASAQPRNDAGRSPDDVRSLAGSNAARRDDFNQSVAISANAVSSGFELAS